MPVLFQIHHRYIFSMHFILYALGQKIHVTVYMIAGDIPGDNIGRTWQL